MASPRTESTKRGPCACCYALWLGLALIAYAWPYVIVWLLAGVVVALILGALWNPVPDPRIDARHVHRPTQQ